MVTQVHTYLAIYITRLTWLISYVVAEKDDSYVILAEKGAEYVKESEEFIVVNVFPWLRYLPSWFPGAGFKNIAKEGYKIAMEMLWTLHERAKSELVSMPSVQIQSTKPSCTLD